MILHAYGGLYIDLDTVSPAISGSNLNILEESQSHASLSAEMAY